MPPRKRPAAAPPAPPPAEVSTPVTRNTYNIMAEGGGGGGRPMTPVDYYHHQLINQQGSYAASSAATSRRSSGEAGGSCSVVQPAASGSESEIELVGGNCGQDRKYYAQLALREARAKFVWAVLVLVARIVFGAIHRLASLSAEKSTTCIRLVAEPFDLMGYSLQLPQVVVSKILPSILYFASSIGSLLVTILPSVLFSPARPGFITSFPPLLQFIKTDFKLSGLPLAPTRMSQYAMGKLSTRQLMVILPVYFVTTLVATALVRFVVPAWALSGGLDPIPYVESSNNGVGSSVAGWAWHLTKEVIANALAVVGLRVVSELLTLNRVGHTELWTALLVIWPLCSMSVDSSGVGSTFTPDIVYALRCVRLWDPTIGEDQLSATSRLGRSAHRLGPVVGGYIAGRIMAAYFPEG